MIQFLNSRSKGFFAWLIAGVITLAFVFLGAQSFFSGSSVIAKVNGHNIEAKEFNRLTSMLLKNTDKTLLNDIDKQHLHSQVLQKLVGDLLLVSSAKKHGVRASDLELAESILAIPEFKKEGKFSKELYFKLLGLNGLTDVEFRKMQQESIIGSRFAKALSDSFFITDSETKLINSLLFKRRDVHYKIVKAEDYLSKVKVDKDEIQQHYYANLKQYIEPAKTSLQYLIFEVDDLKNSIKFNAEELKQYYQENQESFGKPLKEIEALVKEQYILKKASEVFQAKLETITEKIDQEQLLGQVELIINKKSRSSKYIYNDIKQQQTVDGNNVDAKMLRSIFSEANKHHMTPQLYEINEDKVIIFVPYDYHAAKQLELDAVRDKIIAKIKFDKASLLAAAAAKQKVLALNEKSKFIKADGWKSFDDITRTSHLLPQIIAKQAFSFKFSGNVDYTGIALLNGNYAVIAVTAERPAKPLSKELLKQTVGNQLKYSSSAEYNLFVSDLQQKAKIEVYKSFGS